MSQSEIAYIEVDGRSIAYRLRGGNGPTLVFLPGYASDMEGAKALALDAFAERARAWRCCGSIIPGPGRATAGSRTARSSSGSKKRWLRSTS